MTAYKYSVKTVEVDEDGGSQIGEYHWSGSPSAKKLAQWFEQVNARGKRIIRATIIDEKGEPLIVWPPPDPD